MTIKIKHMVAIAALAAMTPSSTSCNSDEPKSSKEPVTQFATLLSVSNSGSTFEMNNASNDRQITVSSSKIIDTTNVKVGNRLLLRFNYTSPQVANTGGPIDLQSYQQVINEPLIAGTAEEWDSWRTQEVNAFYITRTGNYLNMMANVYVLHAPKTFKLVVDSETLNDPYPVAHIIFLSDTSIDGEIRVGYASWDLSLVWKLQSAKGIKVMMANTAGDRVMTFEKDRASITPLD